MGGHYSLFVTALAWSSGHWNAFIFKGFSFKDVIRNNPSNSAALNPPMSSSYIVEKSKEVSILDSGGH